ncbi:MAG: hypothetical protein IKC46_00585 [Lachnospiraceae bacterium]|nr:hypothetical protein [Lachnospiraceae bacterium]
MNKSMRERKENKSYQNFNLAIYCTVGDIKDIRDFEAFDKKINKILRHIKVGRVYLENFRTARWIDIEQLKKVKAYFEGKGIATSGGITTNSPSPDYNISLCYSSEEDREILKKTVAMNAEIFDEFIFDDFFFMNCRCPKCIAKKGNRSWSQFRLEEKKDIVENIVLKTAKQINPDVNVIVKFPNWYEDFNEVGYDIAMETELFDAIYTGTETRNPSYSHQHLPKYLSYFFMRHLENAGKGKNLGGWFDTNECTYNLSSYLEQAYLTLFGKTKEVTLFCLGELVDITNYRLFIPAIGELLDEVDEYLGELGNPVGAAAYLPTNTRGENLVHNYLGMCGVPLEPTITYPEKEKIVFLAEGAAEDKEIVKKMQKSLLDGADVVVTSGFVRKLGDAFKEFANVTYSGKKLTAREYSAAKTLSLVGMYPGDAPVEIPQIEYGINDVWEIAATYGTDANFPIVLRFGYGNGNVSIITIPENTGDMYHYPAAVWEVIRRQFSPQLPVRMDGPAKIQMFIYDNNKVIVRSDREYFEYVTLIMSEEIKEVKDLVSGAVWPVVNGRVTIQVMPGVNYVLDMMA